MWGVKACTVCLETGVTLYSLSTGNLRHEFSSISGIKAKSRSGMPNYLCMECYAFVKKFRKFQLKCQRAHYTLEQMLKNSKEITKPQLKNLNREQLGIMPSLSFISQNRVHYETHSFQWITGSQWVKTTIQEKQIPIFHYSTLTKEETFEDAVTIHLAEEDKNLIKLEDSNDTTKLMRQLLNTVQNQETNNLLEEHKYEIEIAVDNNDNDTHDVGMDYDDNDIFNVSCKLDKAHGSKFNEEYAEVVPISVKEAKAVIEVKKLFMGLFKCSSCGRGFKSREKLRIHRRMHDKHLRGTYNCEICDYYFKTQYMIDTHMTEKHMYKYLCKECPEVSFDRLSAKAHFWRRHMKSESRWDDVERPQWLGRSAKKKTYGYKRNSTLLLTKDMFIFAPITPEEMHSIIQERKNSRNYLEAKYKCEFCFRGYRLMDTYNKHMVKHDPSKSGNLQCDMCKLYFRDQRKMYKHMNMYHLNKFSCRSCDFVSTNRSQAVAHYKWHANVTYDCAHCDKKFAKASTRLTHIRLKHPSTNICNLCGHSFVSSAGLVCHKQITHSKEQIQEMEEVPIDTSHPNFCSDCNIMFATEQAYVTHLGSSSKHVKTNVSVQKTQRDSRKSMRREMGIRPQTREVNLVVERRNRNSSSEVLNTGVTTSNNCEVCGKYLVNDVQARRHYEAEHPGSDYLRRYMCEVCGHTARQYANLLVHMRTHTNEKPYGCPHCDRRFSMLSNRDRHLVVHTGEKRFQCQHCSRRFTQSSAVKLHIQTVHLKIPYAPWDKKNRKRRKELEAAGVSSDLNLVEAPPMPLVSQPQPKLLLDTQGEYLNAYITYSDE